MIVLAVDPGSHKTGLAVVAQDGNVLYKGIEPTNDVLAACEQLAARFKVKAVAIGKGTNARVLTERLQTLGCPIKLVDERETTLRARALYFADHPPRGWRRLVPLGMQMPPRPIDDYAAVLIGQRFLAEGSKSEPS